MHTPTLPPFLVDELIPARRSWRIAMVTETWPPEVNGVAMSVARLVDGLRAQDHYVQLVRPRQHQTQEATHHDGLSEVLTRGMRLPMYGQLRLGLPSKRALVRLWTTQRPDLVHIATEGPLGWSALQAARKLGLPVCSDFRTNFHAYSQFYGMSWLCRPINAYLRKFHNHCDATMVPTDALRMQLAAEGFRSLTVVARGVDTTLFSPSRRSIELRRQWGVADDAPVALHVGRLAPEKNLTVLVQAFTQLQRVQPGMRLIVVGDGPSRQDLQASCPQIVFAGFRAGEDLATHYASSDMFLFPSLTETYGNVTPEAMASGLAVVAFDDAAAAQLIVHKTHGLLAPKGDTVAFVHLSGDLAANPARCRELGRCARVRALELGWDAVVRKVEAIYAMAIARSSIPAQGLVWSAT